MLIGIHPDKIGSQSYSDKWAMHLKARNITYEYINLLDFNSYPDLIRKYDGIMWRWSLEYPDRLVVKEIFELIEQQCSIPVFPDKRLRDTWDNKISQQLELKLFNIKTPTTEIFFKRNEALEYLKKCDYPKVFKLTSGAGSLGVTIVNNIKEGTRLVNRMFEKGIWSNDRLHQIKNPSFITKGKKILKPILYPKATHKSWSNAKLQKGYVYLQEFIDKNEYDIRITVINGKAFAFRRFNRPNDFRASGSGKIDYDITEIQTEVLQLSFDIASKMKLSCVAFDFLKRTNEYILLEYCWAFNDKAIYNCPGYWDKNLKFHKTRIWPEELQVEYFIEKVNSCK